MSFDAMMRRIEAKKKREAAAKKKDRAPYLGDTDKGRTQFHVSPKFSYGSSQHRGTNQFREHRQNPGATKGRGRFGGIRK